MKNLTGKMNFTGIRALGANALLALLLLPASASALQAEAAKQAQKYKVTASVEHLGEVVAAPIIIVEEGTTARVFRGEADEPPDFTMGVLVQSRDGDEVQISLDYSSGNLSAQPNLVVPLGKPYQTSTKKVVLNLQVDLYED